MHWSEVLATGFWILAVLLIGFDCLTPGGLY